MTENDSESVRSLVVGSKRDGRRRYDKQAKRELVQACLEPGVVGREQEVYEAPVMHRIITGIFSDVYKLRLDLPRCVRLRIEKGCRGIPLR